MRRTALGNRARTRGHPRNTRDRRDQPRPDPRARLGRQASAHKRCRFVATNGRLGSARSCFRPVFLTASGHTHWSLRLKRRLPRGIYQVQSRAVDRAGNRQHHADLMTFRVR